MDDRQFERLAGLSRLRFTEAEKEALKRRLDDALREAETLCRLPDDDAAEGSFAVLRGEEASVSRDRADSLKNAPRQKDGFFLREEADI